MENMKIKLSKNQWEEMGKKAGWIKTASSLDGSSGKNARKIINNIISKYSKGLYRDEYWTPVNSIFSDLRNANIDYTIEKTEYSKNTDGIPISKRWTVSIEFVNDKNKPTKLFGQIVASGAGTVSDPLSAYDVVGYFI
jgi:hypothetical protein